MFLHQFCLQMSAWCVTTWFHKGPAFKYGKMKVQNNIKLPKVGSIRNSLDMYSSVMLILFVRCNFPIKEYVVSSPDNIMKGSVYKLAALPSTVHGFPKYCKRI